MRQIFLFIAILLATAANAQRHTPVEIKQLAFRKLPNGQKPLGLDLDKYITSYLATNGGGGGGSVPDTVLAGDRVGVWYYRLKWTDGIYYATSTTKQRKKIDPLSGYNILGQKMY